MKQPLLTLLLLASAAIAAEPKAKPAPILPADVRVEKDIDYLGSDRAEKADLYLPVKLPAGHRIPAVVVIHGGGWTGGDKWSAREWNICGTLAHNGYVVIIINYLLAPNLNAAPAWPQNLHDCKTAVRWLRKNADRYQIDAAHIGVIGGSAGGHLASMVGVTGPSDGLDPKGPYGEFPANVSCVVDLYGPIQLSCGPINDRSDLKTSPLTYLDKNDPPFLILHGTKDGTVAVERSQELAAALQKAGIPSELVIIEDGPHSFHFQPRQRDLRPLALGFFAKHLKPNAGP